MEKSANEHLTTAEAATMLKYTTSRVRQLIRGKVLKAVKFGRDWQIERASVEQYAAAHTRGVPGAGPKRGE